MWSDDGCRVPNQTVYYELETPTPRRLCDEDDELSEVEPDAVPTEVRDWLALTFTRSMSNMKRRGEEKPRFRSVAHAIRAGIMVDRKNEKKKNSQVWAEDTPVILSPPKGLDLKGNHETTSDVLQIAISSCTRTLAWPVQYDSCHDDPIFNTSATLTALSVLFNRRRQSYAVRLLSARTNMLISAKKRI
ncbi:hypothetical protein BaRGS_00014378 [Batillaria attramentaria]|uniref:PDE1 N-terminal domain-containing protein n=1 Tax=Batillaria attramentaria TaxID=370345 RepID=A0ABD0L4N2_9CAEN